MGSILENILPVELAKNWLFQYWASSTGQIISSIDPVEDSENLQQGGPLKLAPKFKDKVPSNLAKNFSKHHGILYSGVGVGVGGGGQL